jgi:hypothetical protein
MSAVLLEWRSLPYEHSKFFVVGTEIAAAYVSGTLSRFAIIETRGHPRTEDGKSVPGDVYYRVRDAATVRDEQVRAGKRAEVVARFDCCDEAIEWCLGQLATARSRRS